MIFECNNSTGELEKIIKPTYYCTDNAKATKFKKESLRISKNCNLSAEIQLNFSEKGVEGLQSPGHRGKQNFFFNGLIVLFFLCLVKEVFV